MEKAAIKDASLHSLRHTLASHLLSNGVPITVVSKMLGHTDANITLRIYSHMLPTDDARAAEMWERIVSAPSVGTGKANAGLQPPEDKSTSPVR
jgi:integrase